MKLDRNVLAAVAIFLFAALLIFYVRPEVESQATGRMATATRPAAMRAHIDPLRLESAPLAASPGPHRNIFAFEEPPAVHPAPVKRIAIAQRPAVVVALQPAAHNDGPVPPPAFPWHCIGRFGPDKAPFVALANDEHQIVNARAGEAIGGQFVIRSIGVESVDVGFIRFPPGADRRIAIGH